MSGVAELAEQIAKLEPLDRERLMQLVEPNTAFMSTPGLSNFLRTPSIVATPGVCGGVPRIIRTRIPVWTLERMRQLGVSEADILRSYPALSAVDLVQAWAYVDAHRDDIERQIREDEEE